MIDPNLFRIRIGSFNHKLRKNKFLKKSDYYRTFNCKESNAGENTLKFIQTLFKIAAILSMMSGAMNNTSPQLGTDTRGTRSVGWSCSWSTK